MGWLIGVVVLGGLAVYGLRFGLSAWGIGLARDATASRCDPALLPDDRGTMDAEFADLGFEPVAAVVITNPRAADAYVRLWLHPDGTMARSWPSSDGEDPRHNPRTVATVFGDGVLATSTVASSDLLPWVLETRVPRATPAELVEAHRRFVADLVARGHPRGSADADLAAALFRREWDEEVAVVTGMRPGERIDLVRRTQHQRARDLASVPHLDQRLASGLFGGPPAPSP